MPSLEVIKQENKPNDEVATDMAKWRALQRMAEMGHDHVRKLDFFAREIVSARYHASTPKWQKVVGWFYEHLSDFGRSFSRPLMGLGVGIFITFFFIFTQASDLRPQIKHIAITSNTAMWMTFPWFTIEKFHSSCKATPQSPTGYTQHDPRKPLIVGLSDIVASRTSIGWEALSLAMRNAFIIGDWGSEIAHRTYGCLYGLERFGDTLAPIVPPWVSFISAIQKLWSTLMWFLLILAVRNQLKMH